MSHLSDDTASTIDSEIKGLLDDCYNRAFKILEDNRDKLELMKDALMEYETIDVAQIDDIMNGQKPRPPQSWSDDGNNDDSSGGAEAVDSEVKVDVSDDTKPDSGETATEH